MKWPVTKSLAIAVFRPGDSIALSAEAETSIGEASGLAGMIQCVNNPHEQKDAVYATQVLHDLIAFIEEITKREAMPHYEKWAKFHEVKKRAIDRLRPHELRLNRLCGDYQQLEAARMQAAAQAQRQALTELEQERAAERAGAASHEELDEIDYRFAAMNAQIATAAPPIANGQKVASDWEFTVTDMLALWKAFPMCIDPKIREREVKELLDIHGALPGVEAKKMIVSKVRKSKEQKAVDV